MAGRPYITHLRIFVFPCSHTSLITGTVGNKVCPLHGHRAKFSAGEETFKVSWLLFFPGILTVSPAIYRILQFENCVVPEACCRLNYFFYYFCLLNFLPWIYIFILICKFQISKIWLGLSTLSLKCMFFRSENVFIFSLIGYFFFLYILFFWKFLLSIDLISRSFYSLPIFISYFY